MTIIAFRSRREYASYRPAPGAEAFFLPGERESLIVLQTPSRRLQQAAGHEYVHFLLERAGRRLPLWLDEGLADFYSTIERRGNRLVLTGLIPAHLRHLRRGAWSHPRSTRITDKAQSYYARSWLLVHMLGFSDRYRARLPAFVASLEDGTDAAEAFAEIYGCTLEQVEADLKAHLERVSEFPPLVAPVADLGETGREKAPRIRVDLIEATILSRIGNVDAADRRFATALEAAPDDATVHEALACHRLDQGDTQNALAHFERASSLGSNSGRLHLDRARLLVKGNAPATARIRVLIRAVELDPGLAPARIELGALLMQEDRPAEALKHLSAVRDVPADSAVTFFCLLARGYAGVGKQAAAVSTARRARELAKSASEIVETEYLVRDLTMSAQPAAR